MSNLSPTKQQEQNEIRTREEPFLLRRGKKARWRVVRERKKKKMPLAVELRQQVFLSARRFKKKKKDAR
jgi:hypothetical protein